VALCSIRKWVSWTLLVWSLAGHVPYGNGTCAPNKNHHRTVTVTITVTSRPPHCRQNITVSPRSCASFPNSTEFVSSLGNPANKQTNKQTNYLTNVDKNINLVGRNNYMKVYSAPKKVAVNNWAIFKELCVEILQKILLPSYPFTIVAKTKRFTLRRCCRVANAFEVYRNAADDNLNSVTRWRGNFP